MPVVARVLLDHVGVDPAQRARLAAPDAGVVEPRPRRPPGGRRRTPPATPPGRRPRPRGRGAPARCRRRPGRTRCAARRARAPAPGRTSCARPRPCAAPDRGARASTWPPDGACAARRRGPRTSAPAWCGGTRASPRAWPARRAGTPAPCAVRRPVRRPRGLLSADGARSSACRTRREPREGLRRCAPRAAGARRASGTPRSSARSGAAAWPAPPRSRRCRGRTTGGCR